MPDYQEGRIGYRFRGTVEEGRSLFQRGLPADLKDMLYGKEDVIPAEHGAWSSFCKTQYANDPRLGGWDIFQRAHLSVCAILEHMRRSGFNVHVSDEGHFWEKRDLAALAKEIGEWDALLAGLGGVLKDTAEAQGVGFESAMSGRPDFERLRIRGVKDQGHCQALGQAAGATAAGRPGRIAMPLIDDTEDLRQQRLVETQRPARDLTAATHPAGGWKPVRQGVRHEELAAEFEVLGFMAPYQLCGEILRRKGVVGVQSCAAILFQF